jgi:hypothetical protein
MVRRVNARRRSNDSLILVDIVITGLDPVIHLLRKGFSPSLMDCRVKPGNDELRAASRL